MSDQIYLSKFSQNFVLFQLVLASANHDRELPVTLLFGGRVERRKHVQLLALQETAKRRKVRESSVPTGSAVYSLEAFPSRVHVLEQDTHTCGVPAGVA